MQALLDVIIPVFLVIGAGYVAVWRDYTSDVAVEALMKFTQGVAIPCLLFRAISTLDLAEGFQPSLLISFYAGAIICFALGITGARMIFKRSWEDAIAIGFCCLFSNSVLLGLPITERAYGVGGLAGNYAIVALHAPFCYFVGITTMEVYKAAGSGFFASAKRIFTSIAHNALVIGIVLGIAVNVTGLSLPVSLTDALDLLARAALPAALFGLGGLLVRYRPEGDMRTILMVCAISLLVHPLISFSLASTLGVERNGFRSLVVTAAMAPGINAYIFASMYGHAKRVAASSVLIATGASVVTVWFWLLLLP